MPIPLEKYAQIILHSGCAIPPKGEQESRKHRWDECRAQKFYLKIARKHQRKLQSNGLTIGEWINLRGHEEHFVEIYYENVSKDYTLLCNCGETLGKVMLP